MQSDRLLILIPLALAVSACMPVTQPEGPKPELMDQRSAALESSAVAAVSRPGPRNESGPAGIVLYCRHQGEIHLLLANDRFGVRGWGGFVGANKKGETTAMTAARETHEETRGYFDQMKLFRQISEQQPVRLWGCHWFVLEVDHVPASKIMEHRIPLLNPAYMETQHYAWVPFSEIEPLLTKKELSAADLRLNPRHLKPNSRSDSFWRVWIDNMRQLHLKNTFPWAT